MLGEKLLFIIHLRMHRVEAGINPTIDVGNMMSLRHPFSLDIFWMVKSANLEWESKGSYATFC